MHGSLGPSAARALWTGRALRIDCASQAIEALPGALGRVLGLPADSIDVRHVPGAGCYGHNGADDAALDAALVARALPGRRVLLKWRREDEHGFEPLGPAMRMDVGADLDASGRVTAWHHEVTSFTHVARPSPHAQGVDLLAARWLEEPFAPTQPTPRLAPEVGIHRNALPLYRFPQQEVVKRFLGDNTVRTSALRGLGAQGNVVAIESFMDELALAAGMAPDAFRRRHLQHDRRALAVLDAVLELAGGLDGSRGLGIARYKNRQCCAAVIAQADVDMETAQVRATRLWIAADAGQIIDPDGLRNQLEGGAVQALSWCLKEAVAFDAYGSTQNRDWESYPILRFSEVPRVETVLLDHPNLAPVGAGEATVGPASAALANAVCRTTGLRVRDLPLTPERLRLAAAQ
jgi:CO/xanthine dehydrogenase Mo-binding subunit